MERRANKLGSRIKTKLVLGVLALSIAPIALHVYYSITLLNRNLDKWFSQPTVEVLRSAERFIELANGEALDELQSAAGRVAADRERRQALPELLREADADYLSLIPAQAGQPRVEVASGGDPVPEPVGEIVPNTPEGIERGTVGSWLYAMAPMPSGDGHVLLARKIPQDILHEQAFMQAQVQEWQQLEAARPMSSGASSPPSSP